MIVFITVLAVLALLLLIYRMRVTLVYKINAVNRDIKFFYEIRLAGGLFKIKKKDKKPAEKKKRKDKGTQSRAKKKPLTLSEIMSVKNAALNVISVLFETIKKETVFKRFDTCLCAALKNPMHNGIFFGGISGVLGILYGQLTANFNVESCHLDVGHDFQSGVGVIFENSGTIYICPIKTLCGLAGKILKCKQLRNDLSKLKRFFLKKEDINDEQNRRAG